MCTWYFCDVLCGLKTDIEVSTMATETESDVEEATVTGCPVRAQVRLELGGF